MDTSAKSISFDDLGRCSFCSTYLAQNEDLLATKFAPRTDALNKLLSRIKHSSRGREYDCIVGVSGGVDSSWALVEAVRLGLKPLAVHMDNGWNTELAQNNIENLIRELNVDLFTYVIEWDEYRRLMQSFFDADVIDIELLYDNAMFGVNYQQALKEKCRFILAGTNQATEGILMPQEWNWFKRDRRNILDIARQAGEAKITTFPAFGTFDYIRAEYLHRTHWTSFLDYTGYDKIRAEKDLVQQYGYKPYRYKHYESVFTRFYQGHILPNKFGVDKRRIHLSNLIVTGQMSRDSALEELERTPYPDQLTLEADINFFLKKMGWARGDLDSYLTRPRREHSEFKSERRRWEAFKAAHKMLRLRQAV
jgi:N-acetyl sugar amidotransferase